jgi:glyoxylase-like metal-dependent hydrolase (beta-lactamase superfamily II)
MKTWSTGNGYRIIQVLGGRSNVFLLTNGQSNVLIDTSPAFMWTLLQKRLDEIHIEKIHLLVLTHSHFDHAANSARIREKYKPQVIIHQSEAEYLATGDNIVPTGTNSFTRFLVRISEKKFRSVALYQPCKFDIAADDFYDLSEYGFRAYLMHTPGHTTGSVSLIVDNEIALVGDTMFGIFAGNIFPPFACDVKQLINSWGKLLQTNCRLFIPSHGTANKRELVKRNYIKMQNKYGDRNN